MHATVYRLATVLCAWVAGVPLGPHFGRVLPLWMLLTGRLLGSRGAVIPARSGLELRPAVVRRPWAAVGQGAGTADQVLVNGQGDGPGRRVAAPPGGAGTAQWRAL